MFNCLCTGTHSPLTLQSKLKGTNGDGGKGLGGGGNTPTSPETPEAGSEDGQAQEEAMEAEGTAVLGRSVSD